jgi:GNAT superfamily N-acetyltransferase
MRVAADCLVRFLATTPKKWAVFSASLGRFVRQHRPIEMWRMELDSPKPFDHKCVLVSDRNKKAAIRLFSEYYDEPWLQSVLRLRKLRSDGNYWTYMLEGGFVTVRLEGETGLIYDIYVTPSMQGKGLGGELMRCALTSLAGRVSSVYLHTSFPRAKSLYENFGFRTIHTQLGIRLDEM